MRSLNDHALYSLYKKSLKSGIFWYVRFWDESLKKYAHSRSTGILVEGKRERHREAEEAAKVMLPRICFNTSERSFIDYLRDFWTPESRYVRECALVKKRPLSSYYIRMNHDDVRRHLEVFPGFLGITLHELTAGKIRDWMLWMSEKGLSGRRINSVLQSMRVAVRYAIEREEIENDPFKKVHEATEQRKEKGILSIVEVKKLLSTPIQDLYSRLAILLGLLCGMRRGEVRGLLWGDLKDGLIHLCHNYQDSDGLKGPKCGSLRTIPIPQSVQSLIESIKTIIGEPETSSFVFIRPTDERIPLSNNFFRYALERELTAIGIPGEWRRKEKAPDGYVNEQKQRNLTFHGLRHTFVTLGRLAGITDLEIQALAGHKDATMMNYYSHAEQVLDFTSAKEKLEKAVG
ncbi:site-specific recombinase, phage integrase family [Treponema primitia ZAS-2]|uniref:Site-specific recombinase, phage integrase family n=1 Tax=Treponema primitia (strain ATCC BAA-887 / DSM 12427 / ZAS-2) TaxID=545694 RepID=F5YI79_TREPZ|nr:site-specific integrase [Treponema primitia]AEF86418.1 site-specific recombinase, phage integrase family [Treponema primitia ZAS-2]